MRNTRAYDIFGNIALVKFDRRTLASAKKRFADKILKSNSSVKTILEKVGKFKGRLRKQETKHIAGEKTKEVLYRENDCMFRFNMDKTYFSPRLSNERKEIANLIKKGNVLVMFAGVGPYSIVIAKHSKADKVFSNEINREANEYAQQNIEMNKLKGKIIMLNGNIQDVSTKVKRGLKVNNEIVPKKFEYIVMPRPQLKDSFLKEAFSLSKKMTTIFYYDFCEDSEVELIVDKIKTEAKNSKKKIKILKAKTAGEIAPHKIRVRVDFKVL